MADVTYPDPGSAWESFLGAIIEQDVERAMSAATEGTWRRHGESSAKVFHTAGGQNFELTDASVPFVSGDRAVMDVRITRGNREGRLYVLLEKVRGSWGVSAGVREEAHAALFLRGVLPPVFEVTDLGPNPMGEQWARLARKALTDEVVLTVEEIGEATRAPVLGALPMWNEDGATAFAALGGDDPVVLAYGDLMDRLLAADVGKVLAFSSATPREGVGAVVGNLATLLAQLNEAVLVIDLNVALPSVHVTFGSFDPAPGLTESLMKGENWQTLTRSMHDNLDVLTAGTKGHLSNESFGAFAKLLEEAKTRYDRILVVVPPVGLGMMGAKLGMSTILVVHAGAVPANVVTGMAQKVHGSGKPLTGVIATRLTPDSVPDTRIQEGLDALRGLAEGPVQMIDVLGTFSLPALNRALVGLSRTIQGVEYPEQEWTCFDTSGDGFRGISMGSNPTLDLILTGVTATLPKREESHG